MSTSTVNIAIKSRFMTIVIIRTDGRWLINGKTYDKLDATEKDFFNQFIASMKLRFECENKQ